MDITVRVRIEGLEGLVDALLKLVPAQQSPADPAPKKGRAALKSVPAPAAEDPAPQDDFAPEPEPPAVDMATVRKLAMDLSNAGLRAQVQAAVVSCGAEKLSAVPEDQLGYLHQKLVALQA